MTILSVEALRDAIAQNSHELAAARVDAELITRLNAAVANVTRLQNVGSELTKALSKAMDAEAKAARAKLLSNVRNLRVADAGESVGLLSGRFTLHCEVMAWDMSHNASIWTAREYRDFAHMPPTVAAVLMQDADKLLPTAILELAPGDADTALDRFFMAKRRGYVAR